MTSAEGRWGYADASSITRTPDSLAGSANASAEGGLLTAQGSSQLPGGLGNTSTSGRVMAGDAQAGGSFKLSREEATLSGKLGASASSMKFKDFYHFLVYAAGVTAHEIMMDSLLRRLTGSGM